jgi:hypothetical protein
MRGIKSPQKENHSRFGTHTQVNRRILFYFVLFPFSSNRLLLFLVLLRRSLH